MNPHVLLLSLALLTAPSIARAESTEPSPAEQRIALARTAVNKHPQRYVAHAQLDMALAQRARETADTA